MRVSYNGSLPLPSKQAMRVRFPLHAPCRESQRGLHKYRQAAPIRVRNWAVRLQPFRGQEPWHGILTVGGECHPSVDTLAPIV